MKSKAFCTVISSSHYSYAISLRDSIRRFDNSVELFVLITDANPEEDSIDLSFIFIDDLKEYSILEKLLNKYSLNSDSFRWSMKSILLLYLLEKRQFDQVFFVDPDVYFFSDFKFLYNELYDRSFLLSPHWGSMDPFSNYNGFTQHFGHGVFNGGFLGVTKKGIDTLKWWAEMCFFSCSRKSISPFYVDQIYLHAFPVRNPDTKILSHKGCNVAIWNQEECRRIVSDSGEVLINGVYPIVFVHFSHLFDLYEQDKLLYPYLLEYSNALIENGHPTGVIEPARNYFQRQALKKLTFLQRIRRKYFGVKYFDDSDF